METPQPPQVSVSGHIVIEGQLSAPGSASSERAPAPPLPPWRRFWKGPPETVLARASVLTTVATAVLAAGTIGLAFVSLSQLHAFDSEATVRLRSYISIAATHTPVEVEKSVIFTVVVQASGQTPAFDVIAQRGGARPMPYPLPPSTQFQDQEIVSFQNLPNKVALSPGNTVTIVNPSPDCLCA
jgi:hypothetical protein